ncbi:MAG TPA: TlpA disulfide reductase family protein [Ruminiclostridium sp.]|nr:TlpA disulfide reductase family protein [Ruminiclostridium sp.]
MKKTAIIWGLAAVLVVAAYFVTANYNRNQALNSPSTSNGLSSESPGGKAIAFSLLDTDGKKVSLDDFKGKYVYLNFFATWCPPCRAEMPDIERVYQEYKNKNLVVLAVNLGEDSKTVKDFFTQNDLSFKALLDSNRSIAQKYGISAIPVSIFIDRQGNIAAKKVGEMTRSDMEANIEILLKK